MYAIHLADGGVGYKCWYVWIYDMPMVLQHDHVIYISISKIFDYLFHGVYHFSMDILCIMGI